MDCLEIGLSLQNVAVNTEPSQFAKNRGADTTEVDEALTCHIFDGRPVHALGRFYVMGLVEKHRAYFANGDEVYDIHRLRRFHVGTLEVLVLQYHEFALFLLAAFYDLVPRNSLAVNLRLHFLFDWTQIPCARPPEFQFIPRRGRGKSDRNINQAETDRACPCRTPQPRYLGRLLVALLPRCRPTSRTH
jgi:hypothetical protein